MSSLAAFRVPGLPFRAQPHGGDGGYGDDELGDTWVWDGLTWTLLNIQGPPVRVAATWVSP